jgi:hypothetical protein
MRKASKSLTIKFCSCIKSLVKSKRFNESSAIAICTKSVLQTKGKTLGKFKCRKAKLFTQKKKN